MGVLPSGNITINEEGKDTAIQTSRTYKIDFDKKKVVGFTDELDAIKQAVFLILFTERFEYLIYSDNYGSEIVGLMGKDRTIAESQLKRLIREALLADDRIKDVDNFIFEHEIDSVTVKFTVFSIFGDFETERQVR